MFRASTVLLPLRWVVWCLWVAWLSLRVIAEASCGVKNSLFLGNIPTSTSWTLGCFESGVMLGFTTLFGEPFFPETAKVLHTGVASTAFPTSTMAGAERRQMILISGGFSRAMLVCTSFLDWVAIFGRELSTEFRSHISQAWGIPRWGLRMKDEPEMKGCPDSLPGYRLCLSHILVTHSKLGESLVIVIVGENSPHMEEHMNMKKTYATTTCSGVCKVGAWEPPNSAQCPGWRSLPSAEVWKLRSVIQKGSNHGFLLTEIPRWMEYNRSRVRHNQSLGDIRRAELQLRSAGRTTCWRVDAILGARRGLAWDPCGTWNRFGATMKRFLSTLMSCNWCGRYWKLICIQYIMILFMIFDHIWYN